MDDASKKVSKADVVPHAHYMRPLDGIRGMACMLVIASHISQILHIFEKEFNNYLGSLGVVVFFVLSGFLMSALYTNQKFTWERTAKYAIARFTRIAPAYWIAILFAWVLYLNIPGYHYQMTPWNMVRSVFFGGNQGVFWSIPPEVQFYGFFLLLWGCWHAFKNGARLWLYLLAAVCVAFIATKDMWGGLMLPSKLHIFLSGFVMAFLPKVERIRAVIYKPLFQIAMTIITFAYGIMVTMHLGTYNDVFFPVLVGLWIASLSGSSVFTAPFETMTMRTMGAASFSIYLFHDAILFALYKMGWFTEGNEHLNIAAMILISLAIPVAFHYIAERRLNIWSKEKMLVGLAALQTRYPRLKD